MSKTRNTFKQLAHDCMFRRIHSSKLIYNSCWEDSAIDRRLMQLDGGSRIVMITSAGCNALNYLLDSPEEIHCVDVNPKQNALLHLKLAAAAKLEHEDLFMLFGLGRHENYLPAFDFLKDAMPGYAVEFWQQHMNYFSGQGLRKSFYYHGAAGNVALMIRQYLKMRKGLREMLYAILDSNSLDEQRELYDRIEPEFWTLFTKLLVANPFILAMLGVPRPQIQLIRNTYPGGVLAYIKDKLRHVFTELPAQENYFWRVYIRGEYTPNCCPDYLKAENYALLQANIKRVHVYNSTVTGFLQAHPDNYTHFVLLDHQDWLAAHDVAALEEEWMQIIHNSAENAKLIMRSAAQEINFIPGLAAANLKTHPEYTSRLHQLDRVGTYGNLMFAEVV